MLQNIASQIRSSITQLWAKATTDPAKANPPFNELQRQKVVEEYDLNSLQSVKQYEEIVQQAAFVCGTPIALMSIPDGDRQFFKAKTGLDGTEVPREWAFCSHAILAPYEVMEVEDTQLDARFADNPLVVEDPTIRFYAGVPIVSVEGYPLGTLCVLDQKPRKLTEDQKLQLKLLTQELIIAIELHQRLDSQQP
jgi:GAF domain-containing protein